MHVEVISVKIGECQLEISDDHYKTVISIHLTTEDAEELAAKSGAAAHYARFGKWPGQE